MSPDPTRRARGARPRRGLVGTDVSRTGLVRPPARRWLAPALVGLLLAGLVLAALRVDLIRVRYGLAESLEEERALLEERRALQASVRAHRDPVRLADRARELGLGRPERRIELPAVSPGNAPPVSGEAAP